MKPNPTAVKNKFMDQPISCLDQSTVRIPLTFRMHRIMLTNNPETTGAGMQKSLSSLIRATSQFPKRTTKAATPVVESRSRVIFMMTLSFIFVSAHHKESCSLCKAHRAGIPHDNGKCPDSRRILWHLLPYVLAHCRFFHTFRRAEHNFSPLQ